MRRAATDAAFSRRSLFKGVAAVGATAAGNALPLQPGHAAADGPARFPIGVSVQGRPIDAIRVGAGAIRVMIVGGIHTGNEINTVDLVATFADYFTANAAATPAAASLTFIPALNIDGIALGRRTNARDVDLNRNWPARWQPEAYHDDEIVSGAPRRSQSRRRPRCLP
jgi:murein tripeptide amidase MpaA